MSIKRTLAIDLDGTIFQYKTWMGINHFGKPEKKVRECLAALRKLQFEIIVHTCRLNNIVNDQPLPELRLIVKDALDRHGIPYDGIFSGSGKPVAEFYVDDRAVHYAGNWEETMKEIISRAERAPQNV